MSCHGRPATEFEYQNMNVEKEILSYLSQDVANTRNAQHTGHGNYEGARSDVAVRIRLLQLVESVTSSRRHEITRSANGPIE